VPPPRPWFDPPDATERAILDLIARGRTASQIGRALHLSRTGVESRLRFLAFLWRVESVRALLVLAGQCRWARVPDRERQQPVLRSVGVPRIKGRMTERERHPWRGAA
jgi:DNA-binding CsgD family transcriptional regulator